MLLFFFFPLSSQKKKGKNICRMSRFFLIFMDRFRGIILLCKRREDEYRRHGNGSLLLKADHTGWREQRTAEKRATNWSLVATSRTRRVLALKQKSWQRTKNKTKENRTKDEAFLLKQSVRSITFTWKQKNVTSSLPKRINNTVADRRIKQKKHEIMKSNFKKSNTINFSDTNGVAHVTWRTTDIVESQSPFSSIVPHVTQMRFNGLHPLKRDIAFRAIIITRTMAFYHLNRLRHAVYVGGGNESRRDTFRHSRKPGLVLFFCKANTIWTSAHHVDDIFLYSKLFSRYLSSMSML